MIVISPTELRSNMKKYFDIARNETVIIQRGKKETFVLTEQKYNTPDDDLSNAITADQLLVGIEEDIKEMFRKRAKK